MSLLPLSYSDQMIPEVPAEEVRQNTEASEWREKKKLFDLAHDFFRGDNEEELIVRLCELPVNLSAPLLRATLPTLTPEALLALVTTTGEAHHRLIATRPALDRRVVKALLRTQADSVALALVQNPAICLDEEDQAFVARRAQNTAALRTAILENMSLPLAQSWLRGRLREWRDADAGHGNLKLIALLRGGEPAGFVRELSRRLKCDLAKLSGALNSSSAVPLGLSLRAAGFDRAAFMPLLTLWQTAYDGAPYLPESARPLLLSVFSLSPQEAMRKLDALINRVH